MIAIIILGVGLVASLVINLRLQRKNRTLTEDNKMLKWALESINRESDAINKRLDGIIARFEKLNKGGN